jgi:hypothetical protein
MHRAQHRVTPGAAPAAASIFGRSELRIDLHGGGHAGREDHTFEHLIDVWMRTGIR